MIQARRVIFWAATIIAYDSLQSLASDAVAPVVRPHPISELGVQALVHLGKTADWVVIDSRGPWVGSTGPNAVHHLDPVSNRELAMVRLPGEPCAGLAVGSDSLWVPLCAQPSLLARVDLLRERLSAVFKVGSITAESGIAASPDSVWLATDNRGTLIRVDVQNGSIRQRLRIPAGSYNPFYSDGTIWITQAAGATLSSVEARSGKLMATINIGPGPRFLTAAEGAIWTLNQGDGTLTRIDEQSLRITATTALGTPGHGGDISYGGGMVWTSIAGVPLSMIDARTGQLLCQWAGAGGDSLAIGFDSIWLTDYHAGTVSRLSLGDTIAKCHPSRH